MMCLSGLCVLFNRGLLLKILIFYSHHNSVQKERGKLKKKIASGIMLTLLLVVALVLTFDIQPVESTESHDVAVLSVTISHTPVVQG